VVRERVLAARQRQLHRFEKGKTRHRTNAELSLGELEAVALLDDDSRTLLEQAATNLGLSARAFVKVLRVARTVADLEGSERVQGHHLSEAVQGRLMDRREVSDPGTAGPATAEERQGEPSGTAGGTAS
jgi:magnesium chelatase family protein